MKMPIKPVLLGGFLGLIVFSILFILVSSYITSERVLLKHARDIMENIATLTVQQSQSFLEPAQDAARLTGRLADSDVVSSEDTLSLERYFTEQLSLHQQIAGIYYGNQRGEFIYVMKNSERTENGKKSKFILNRKGKRTVDIVWRDSMQNIIGKESDPEDSYDPRSRPWYIKAYDQKKLIWTDPYIFFTSKKPGITTASPVYDSEGNIKGIVGVDIEIDNISIFLSKLKVGKNGLAFIVNRNKDIIAFPDESKIMHPLHAGSDEFRLTKISELDDPLSRKSYEAASGLTDSFDIRGPIFSTFRHEDKNYHTMFAPFSNTQWPWIIGIYLPEDDYLGPIKHNRLFNIVIGLIIAGISCIIGLIIARGISRPMEALRSEAMAIEKYDLETSYDKKSSIREVQETADAFAQMKAGLEKFRIENEKIAESLRQKASELEESKTQLHATFTSLLNFADALIVLDQESTIRFMNPAAESLLMRTAPSMMGQKFPFPVSVDVTKEIALSETGRQKTIVEMSVVATEWESREALLIALRDISERKHAEHSLSESNIRLKDMVTRLQRREEQLTAIGKMAEFFQICSTEQEILRVISESMVKLFSTEAGTFFIADADGESLEARFAWGDNSCTENSFNVRECWALKKGRAHSIVAGTSHLHCEHITDRSSNTSYLCFPVATSSALLGMLHLHCSDSTGNDEGQHSSYVHSLLELGRTVAEHISLALSNVRMQEKLKVMAIQDPLTGLYNRRYMQEFLEHELYRAEREKRPVSVILIDIDLFKSINDRFGHHAGDHALKDVAVLLKSNIRKGDICCRYGGEEFLLVLPDSSYTDTVSLAEKLRVQVKEMDFTYDGRSIGSMTISLGVASYPDHASSYDDLVKSADIALYTAKEKGRDQVS